MEPLRPRGKAAIELIKRREFLQRKFGAPIPWETVLESFFDEIKDKEVVLKENVRLREELQNEKTHHTQYLEKLLSSGFKSQEAPYNSANHANFSLPQNKLPLPPGVQEKVIPPRPSKEAQAFIKEIASHCDGRISLKPSEVCSVKFKEVNHLPLEI